MEPRNKLVVIYSTRNRNEVSLKHEIPTVHSCFNLSRDEVIYDVDESEIRFVDFLLAEGSTNVKTRDKNKQINNVFLGTSIFKPNK